MRETKLNPARKTRLVTSKKKKPKPHPPQKKVRKEPEQYAPLEKLLSLSLLRPGGGDCTQEEVRESERRSLKRNEGSKTEKRQKEEREREREERRKKEREKERKAIFSNPS
jgi:hypothetical protein